MTNTILCRDLVLAIAWRKRKMKFPQWAQRNLCFYNKVDEKLRCFYLAKFSPFQFEMHGSVSFIGEGKISTIMEMDSSMTQTLKAGHSSFKLSKVSQFSQIRMHLYKSKSASLGTSTRPWSLVWGTNKLCCRVLGLYLAWHTCQYQLGREVCQIPKSPLKKKLIGAGLSSLNLDIHL